MPWNYWDVAWTSFLSNLALPLKAATHYYAALAFGVGEPVRLFAAALLGGAVTVLLHTALGAGLERANSVRHQPKFLRFRHRMGRWGVWTLLIPGLRFQGLLVILFAVIGVHPRRVVLCGIVGLALGYALTSFVSHDARMLTYFLTPH